MVELRTQWIDSEHYHSPLSRAEFSGLSFAETYGIRYLSASVVFAEHGEVNYFKNTTINIMVNHSRLDEILTHEVADLISVKDD